MAIDINSLSNEQLTALYQSMQPSNATPATNAIKQIETGGAPDSSKITNPGSTASGSMQVLEGTRRDPGFGVKPSNGTPEDTARVGRDYYNALQKAYGGSENMAALAYNWGPGNTDKWLQGGASVADLPDDQLKYLHKFQQLRAGSKMNAAVQQPLAKPGVATPTSNATKNLEGLGMQAANFLGGAVESPFIAVSTLLHGAENLYNGQGASEALGNAVKSGAEEFQMLSPENLLNKVGVPTEQLHGTAGYDLPAKAFDFMFDKGPRMLAPLLAQGIAGTGTGLSELPVKPQDIEDVTHLQQGLMLASPVAGLFRGKGGAEVPQDLQQKLATGQIDQPGMENAAMPNEIPQRVPYRQYFEQPELFDNETQGQVVEGPGLGLRPDVADQIPTQTRGGLSNARQMDLQYPGETLRVSPEGEVFPESVSGYRDQMTQRVSDFNEAVRRGDDFIQGDLFNELDQRRFDQYQENSRPLNSTEFEETLHNLASVVDEQGRPRTGFDIPDVNDPAHGPFIDAAYGRYLDIIQSEHGDLFDRPTMAKRFAEVLKKDAVERFLQDHPVIKASEAKISNLEALLASNPDSQTRSWAARDLQNVKDTLEKARTNLAKNYNDSGLHPTERDGITYLHSGLPIPDWIKNGLVRMLQGLHGMIFRFLNNRMKGPDNVNSFGKIVGKGIKDAINREANRNWQVKKDESAVDKLQSGPLGKFEAIKEWVPDDRPYEEVKGDFMKAEDMDSSWLTKNVTAQGGLWASAISKSPIAKWAYTKVNNAVKRTDAESKRLLTDKQTGLRTYMQAMNPREKGEIHALMDMNEGEKVFTENELRQRGFNPKQIAYYKRFQEVMGEIFDKFNAGRRAAGMPEIEPRVAYMTSRFMGDFRSMIYQKGTTRPVGFVGHNSRWALNQVIKHIEEQNPGKYDFEKPTLNRGPDRASPNMFQGYLNVINHFELNDPEMKAIMDTYRQYFSSNAAKAMGALKHAKDKQGIMGAEGRKAWLDQEQNASDGMKSQLQYAEHMIKWSEMQDAAGEINKMLGDEDLNDKPNAKSYVFDYLGNALGQNKSALNDAMNAILNGVAEQTGVGPSIFRKANNAQKSALLQMWLGFMRIPHSLLTMTQFFQSNPGFAQLVKSRGLDVSFWGNTMKGVNSSMNIAKKSLGIPTELKGIDKAIYDYNQKNGVFAVQLKSHLTDINNSAFKRKFDSVAEANITYPEAVLRAITFSIWTHALTESGMPLKEALGTAENLTRGALVDYRPTERPLVFGKMGFLGDIASTLTRFKMNQLSQHQYFAKEAIKGGSVAPLATMLLASVAFAGLSGVLGFNYADELYHGISYLAGKPDRLKAMMLRNMPDWANYGLFSQLGINMQGSYSNADTIPDNPIAALFPTGNTLADMMTSVGQAVYYHDAATAKKLAYNFLPTSLKGIAENTAFSKDLPNGNKQFFNPNTNQLQSERTPGEQVARDLAFHPFQEARDADVRRFAKEEQADYASLREKDLTRYTNKLATGTVSQSDVETLRKDWIAHRGGPEQLATSLEAFYKSRALTANQREIGVPQSLGDIYKFQDIQAMKGSKK